MSEPALTDEELARLMVVHVRIAGFHVRAAGFRPAAWCRDCRRDWPCPTARLIAALRANDAELEGYVELIHSLTSERDRLRAEVADLRVALRETMGELADHG